MIGPASQCLTCAHWRLPLFRDDDDANYADAGEAEPTQTCEAYPAGIPDEVWANRADHRYPQAGDGGLLWASFEGAEFPAWAMDAAPQTAGQRAANDLIGLLTRAAAGVIDAEGHVHAPKGLGILSGRFVALPEGGGGMSDAEFDARQERVGRVIGESYDTHGTHVTHRDSNGAWAPERDAVHREIASDLYEAAVARGVPAEGRAVFSGGLGGAGKGTVLREHAGINVSDYVTVDPDAVKEALAERGLIPEIPEHPDLSPMERSVLVHPESQRISALIADMAYRDRRNIIWDTTMGSAEWTASVVADLRNRHGYTDVRGVFVDIPVEVSIERALQRYRLGQDDYLAGKGLGGRFVEPSYILSQRSPRGGTINRDAFDRLRDQFDTWSLFDNATHGHPPRLLAEGRGRQRHGSRGRSARPPGRRPAHR